MNSELKQHTDQLKRQVMEAFEQGTRRPVPQNSEKTIRDLLKPEAYARLGDYIDHYHAPTLDRGLKPDPEDPIPLGGDSHPTLGGLLRYLDYFWLPTLLDTKASGVRLKLHLEDGEDRLDFWLSLDVSPDKVEAVNPLDTGDRGDLLHGLQGELEGRDR